MDRELIKVQANTLKALAASDINITRIDLLSPKSVFEEGEGAWFEVEFEYRKDFPNGTKWAKTATILCETSLDSVYKLVLKIVRDIRQGLVEDSRGVEF